jgi:hypothetical protein
MVLVLVAALAVFVVDHDSTSARAAGESASTSSATPTTVALTPFTGSPEQLTAIAFQAAAGSEEGHPTYIQWVASTRGPANELASGEGGPGGVPVYLLQLHGSFVCDECSHPAAPDTAADTPRGTWMTLVLDRRTGHELDFGLTDHPVDLSKLGEVQSAS